MGRAPCCDKANVKRGPWSPEEDMKLKGFIEKHGTGGNWIALPRKAGLKRCGKSCRLRWLNYLRPNIKHGEFSDDEDRIICNLFATMGSRWSFIAAHLPGRTDNDIKNYWNTKLKKKLLGIAPMSQRKPQSHHHQQQLSQVVFPSYFQQPSVAPPTSSTPISFQISDPPPKPPLPGGMDDFHISHSDLLSCVTSTTTADLFQDPTHHQQYHDKVVNPGCSSALLVLGSTFERQNFTPNMEYDQHGDLGWRQMGFASLQCNNNGLDENQKRFSLTDIDDGHELQGVHNESTDPWGEAAAAPPLDYGNDHDEIKQLLASTTTMIACNSLFPDGENHESQDTAMCCHYSL